MLITLSNLNIEDERGQIHTYGVIRGLTSLNAESGAGSLPLHCWKDEAAYFANKVPYVTTLEVLAGELPELVTFYQTKLNAAKLDLASKIYGATVNVIS